MAKYARFDPRNKKKNRHKNLYLGRYTYKSVHNLSEENESKTVQRTLEKSPILNYG